jgi:hypothetical protein
MSRVAGRQVKDYGFMFRDDPELVAPARRISALTRDIAEIMSEIGLLTSVSPVRPTRCLSQRLLLQHGQQVRRQASAESAAIQIRLSGSGANPKSNPKPCQLLAIGTRCRFERFQWLA